MRFVIPCALLLIPGLARAADPNTVQRHGPGYRYTQGGWIVLHIEGEPYARGEQHGRLLAPEIAAHVRCFSSLLSSKDAASAWKLARTLTGALFLRDYDKEYLEEMKGIADGAASAGARFDGRRIDLLDIATLNAWPEIETLDSALQATPDGLEELRLAKAIPRPKQAPKPMHCSAFAATGPATADGKIVFGHITMFGLYPANFYNVWLDVKPAKGRRVVMQSFPGGIHSGMDYYINDAGIMLTETTIAQTHFDKKGTPLASRVRKSIQYGETIDQVVAILKKDNNGLYTNEWLLGDANTDEIAMFSLGTQKTSLRRSGKNEWFGNTPGFYWGCNNLKDLDLRLETIPSASGRPASLTFVPAPRDRAWLRLYADWRGKIDAAFGRVAFTTPPLASYSSVDAKFTTAMMAKRMETYALFGPPLGRTWHPRDDERKRYPEIRSLVSHPWTTLTAQAPKGETKAVDLHDPAGKKLPDFAEAWKEPETTPAWRGSFQAATDADLWLALGWSPAERFVATENGIRRERELTKADREGLAALRHGYRSLYERARAEGDSPLSALKGDIAKDGWHRLAQGKGTLALLALRDEVGAKFDEAADDFGRKHAGRKASAEAFLAHVAKATGKDLRAFRETWIDGKGLPGEAKAGPFNVAAFYAEIDESLIVVGTKDDAAANAEAALALQEALRRRGHNVTVPIVKDKDLTKKDAGSRHLLFVGRPATQHGEAPRWPATWGETSFTLNGETYAHAETSALMAAESPHNRRYSAVLIAGTQATGTEGAARRFADRGLPTGEVVVFEQGKRARPMAR